jgi:hypothetical protein
VSLRRAALALVPLLSVGGFCCVAEGTNIDTPAGQTPIERIKVGDRVFSVDVDSGERVVTTVTAVRSAERECVALQFDDARLTLTPDHPVYSPELRKYVPAGRWVTGSARTLARFAGSELREVAVGSVASYAGVHRVFDLTVASEHHNFIAGGVVVHNKSPAYDGEFEDEVTVECEERCAVTQPCTDLYATHGECEATCMSWYDDLAPFGESCVAAQDADSRCIADLSCAEVNEYLSPTDTNYPCQSSFSIYVEECYFDGSFTPPCTAFCDTTLSCADPAQVDWPFCMFQCGAPIRDAGLAGNTTCEDALNEQRACVGALSCAGYQAWADGDGDYPCQAETNLVNATCI